MFLQLTSSNSQDIPPFLPLKKAEARLPSATYMKPLRQRRYSAASLIAREQAHKNILKLHLKRNPNELSITQSPKFSSRCQFCAYFEKTCTHLKNLYMHAALKQDKYSVPAERE